MRVLRLASFFALFACSSPAPSSVDGGIFKPPPGTDGGIKTDVGCAADTKLVYVISRDSYLYKFDPPSAAFTAVGRVDCFNGGSQVFSMTVDRSGTAWVLYLDGGIYKVSTKDATCALTGFNGGQKGFDQFGMAFSSDTPGGPESLYASDLAGKGLARIDPKSLVLSYVGPYDGAVSGRAAALTGTGDGHLFGFFTTTPARVGEIEKKTAHVPSSVSLTGINTGTDWAFAFWGGDFYLFTGDQGGGLPQSGSTSTVTRYRPADGSLVTVVKNAGFYVVGAGVSTCAPVVSPTPN